MLAEFVAPVDGRLDVLEVGCGPGLFRTRIDAIPFRRHLGFDVSPAAIDKACPLTDDRTAFAVAVRPGPHLEHLDVVVANEVMSCPDDDPARFLDDVAGCPGAGRPRAVLELAAPGRRRPAAAHRRPLRPVQDIMVHSLVASKHGWRVGDNRLRTDRRTA